MAEASHLRSARLSEAASSPDYSSSVGKENRSAVGMVFYANRRPFTRTLRYDTVY